MLHVKKGETWKRGSLENEVGVLSGEGAGRGGIAIDQMRGVLRGLHALRGANRKRQGRALYASRPASRPTRLRIGGVDGENGVLGVGVDGVPGHVVERHHDQVAGLLEERRGDQNATCNAVIAHYSFQMWVSYWLVAGFHMAIDPLPLRSKRGRKRTQCGRT